MSCCDNYRSALLNRLKLAEHSNGRLALQGCRYDVQGTKSTLGKPGALPRISTQTF